MTDEPKKPVIRFEDAATMPGDDEIDLRRERVSTFAKGGVLYFPKAWPPAMARLIDSAEYVVPKDDPRARMHRPAGTVTGRFSGKAIPQFVMQISMSDKISPEFAKIRRTLKVLQDSAYYGKRIATLIHSTDPRQRKRGKRLRDTRFAFGTNWSETEARMMVQAYRDSVEGAKLAAFWNTQLGEPYDPERYRKD